MSLSRFVTLQDICANSLRVGVLLSSLMTAPAALAEVRLPAIISTHMVVQANSNPRIWGWAAPSEQITVKYLGKTLRTTSDASGEWQVNLGKIKPGVKFDLNIDGTNALSIKDVLAGEVWVCSGQSNMEFPLAKANNSSAEFEAHSWPQIRFFKVKEISSATAMNDVSGAWTVFSPQAARSWSAVGYFFAKDLSEQLKRPVGMIQSLRGGTMAQVWMSRDALGKDSTLASIWAPGSNSNNATSAFDAPSGLFNGMISGVTPYTISGITWYQGESNVRQAQLYKKLFPALIEDWRTNWKVPDLPFIFVQLPNFGGETSADADWATLREAQAEALKLKKTAMAVTIDVGESKNKHPTNKQPVGHRLALNALDLVYGKKLPSSGPVLKSMKVVNGTIVCQFNNTDNGVRTKNGAPVAGFQICGVDKRYVPACARINGGAITVSSPQVTYPTAIRYAWANDPEANLENGCGLPAAPFRTE